MEFQDFDITSFQKNSQSLIISPKINDGFFLCKKLIIHKFFDVSCCFVFSNNEELINYFKHFLNFVIYKKYNSKIIEEIIEKQSKKKLKHEKNYEILIIFDNIKFDSFHELFNIHNNIGITILILSQNPIQLKNLNYIFLYDNCNKQKLTEIYNYYGNIFQSFISFHMAYNSIKKNCLVLVPNISNNYIYDNVFIFKFD
jgi:hypothetical protein